MRLRIAAWHWRAMASDSELWERVSRSYATRIVASASATVAHFPARLRGARMVVLHVDRNPSPTQSSAGESSPTHCQKKRKHAPWAAAKPVFRMVARASVLAFSFGAPLLSAGSSFCLVSLRPPVAVFAFLGLLPLTILCNAHRCLLSASRLRAFVCVDDLVD